MEALLGRVPGRPRLVLLNKVAVTPDRDFYTLERFGSKRMPYRILSRKTLEQTQQAMGYRTVASWQIPERTITVHGGRHPLEIPLIGEAWETIV